MSEMEYDEEAELAAEAELFPNDGAQGHGPMEEDDSSPRPPRPVPMPATSARVWASLGL